MPRSPTTDDRDVRLYRSATDDEPSQLRLKIYRRGGLIPLSEAVPVLENFGFRVLEEMPTAARRGGALGYIHDFLLELPDAATSTQILARAAMIEQAIAERAQRRGRE